MEQTIGKRIMENRKRLGLTQDALAEKLGVTAQAVSKWENDLSCPDIATLPKLADIFHISVDELLGRSALPVHTAEVVEEEEPEGIHIQNGSWEFKWDSGRREALTFAVLVLLVVVGIGSALGYLTFRYTSTSRSADYTDKQRIEANQTMTELVLEETEDWDSETLVCIVDSAFRPMFEDETDYTVSVYVLDGEAFAAGQASDSKYDMNTLWGYSKSGPKKDQFQSLIKVASCKVVKNEKTGEILDFVCTPVE